MRSKTENVRSKTDNVRSKTDSVRSNKDSVRSKTVICNKHQYPYIITFKGYSQYKFPTHSMHLTEISLTCFVGPISAEIGVKKKKNATTPILNFRSNLVRVKNVKHTYLGVKKQDKFNGVCFKNEA